MKKFWKRKDKSKSANPFDEYSDDSGSFSTEYSQTSTAVTSGPVRDTYEEEAGTSRYSRAPTAAVKQSNPLSSLSYSQDRQNLFGGYTEPIMKYDSNGQEDHYGSSRLAETDEDIEVAQIQHQIRNVKQDTLQSTRNALQKIGEAESAASNTMNMLGTQSTQIANVNRNLDLSKAYSDRAQAQAGELKQLNRSIFIPVVKNPFTKGSRERKAMEERKRDHEEHTAERDDIRKFEYDSSARIEDAYRKANREKAPFHKQNRSQADRNRYQFEPDEHDDVIEDEIDNNLDLLGDATATLKAMATGMNNELDSQNKQLSKMNKKVDPINAKLMSTTHTLDSTR